MQIGVEILAPSVLWLACAALLAFATLKDGTQPEGMSLALSLFHTNRISCRLSSSACSKYLAEQAEFW